MHRRNMLNIGSLGIAGLTLPIVLHAEDAMSRNSDIRNSESIPRQNVIMIWLGGGPPTIDMWDLKPDAQDTIRGPFDPVATSVPGIQISEHMPKLAQLINQCTLVRSISHSIPAHGPGTAYMQTGNKPTPAVTYPSIGSVVTKLSQSDKEVPPYVTFGSVDGGTAGYLGPAFNPYLVQGNGVRGLSLPRGVSLEKFAERTHLLKSFDYRFAELSRVSDVVAGMEEFQQSAIDILRSDRTRQAFQLGDEPATLRQRYGNNTFGRNAMIARRLIEAGVRFVTISNGGWDTHSNNFDSLRNRLLPPLDAALSTLIDDLNQHGMLDSTIVFCAGEFGRTPRINDNSGRDHWARSMAVLFAGGRFPRGAVYGKTTDDGSEPELDACSPEDIASTLIEAIGIDTLTELKTPSGRPMQLFREGTVLKDLLS